MKRIFFIIAAIIATVFIFSNSAKDAHSSSEQSGVIVDVVMQIIESIGFTPPQDYVVHAVRKCAHIVEFCLQGFLLAGCFFGTLKKRLLPVLALGLATACVDECLQLFFAGRAGMIQDVFIDFTGTFLGFSAAFLPIFKKLLHGKDVS